MPRPSNAVPTLRRHKSSGQAVTTVRLPNGTTKDLYLGNHGSAAARTEYARVVALVAANGGTFPDADTNVTVAEAIARFKKHAEAYYKDADGKPLRSLDNLKDAIRYVRELFGPLPLADFGPVQYKAVRSVLINEGRVRVQVNKRMGLVRQFVKWCVEEQLVPVSIYETLRCVAPLAPGRSGVKDAPPREPADPQAVDAALPHMPTVVRAIVQLLRFTGARPSEILNMTTEEIDRSSEVWRYTPSRHKTSWKNKKRVIYLGAQAQTVLAPWLDLTPAGEVIFSPARADAMRQAERSAARKTKLYPSHARRNESKRVGDARKRKLGDRYDFQALGHAVRRACKKADCKPFCPYALRHLKAVELRERFGLESVRAVLGQSVLSVAEMYARGADEILATRAAAEIG